MLNKIIIMGRLTRDPELRHTNSNISVCSFSIACDRDFKNEKGEKETDFVDVVVWRSAGEFVSKYFAKGRMAVIEGRLQIREWTDKEGNKRRTAEIIAESVYFGDSKPSGGQDNTSDTQDNTSSGQENTGNGDDFQIPEDFEPDFADQM